MFFSKSTPIAVAVSVADRERAMDGDGDAMKFESNNLEAHLLLGEPQRDLEVVGEVKKQLTLAGPLVVVSFLQYSLQLISIMFIGHLGELPLSGASMALSFAGVTGFSLLVTNYTCHCKPKCLS